MQKGKIHSIESFGALDGPGLRTVVFMQGCPLRCKFCHNIDVTLKEGGTEYSVEKLTEKLLQNKTYWESYEGKDEQKGGVTFSGGEPLMQWEFITEVCKKLKQETIHIAIDTCLFTRPKAIETLLPYPDLWMVSLKHMDEEKHRDLTGVSNITILENLKLLDELITSNPSVNSKIRIRFVVIPGITDREELINEIGEFVSSIKNLEVIELLPYISIGKHKWKEIFGEYPLEGINDGEAKDIEKVKEYLEEYNIQIKS